MSRHRPRRARKNWKKASDEQRKTYMELFPKYVAKLYAIQFSDYAGPDLSRSVAQRRHGTHHRAIRSISRTTSDSSSTSSCRAAARARRHDVKVEGVSLLVTKRSEFDSVIAQKGIDGLIQALRPEVDETRIIPAPAAPRRRR